MEAAPAAVVSLPIVPANKGTAEEVNSKTQLHHYTQKEGMPLPSYYTVNEGFDHAPQFRCTVTIGETTFTSPLTFAVKRAGEHYAAKYALDRILANIKSEVISPILNENALCKSILNEYAAKMKMELPKYETSQQELNRLFVSSVSFGGKIYTGHVAKSKKEAERFGACAAIESILGSDTATVMSNIIRSKSKLYKEIYSRNGANSVHAANMPRVLTNPVSNSACSGDRKDLACLPETGNSLAALQPEAISYWLPSDKMVPGEDIPSNVVASLHHSSDVVHQISKKRKKKNKGKSLAKKPNNKNQPQSGPLGSSEAPEPSSQEKATPLSSTANLETLPPSTGVSA